MSNEQLKNEAISWALRQGSFPLREQWIVKNYTSDPPPCGHGKIATLFGSYNAFRTACGVPIINHLSSDPITLAVLRRDCIEVQSSKNSQIKTPCWEWQKQLDDKGYPKKSIGGKTCRLHRYVHEVIGANPKPSDKHTVDHICQNRSCIAPTHLRWATPQEQSANTTRSSTTRSVNTPPAKSLQERLNWYLSRIIEDSSGCWTIPMKPTEQGYVRISYERKAYLSHIIFKLYSLNKEITKEDYEVFTESNIIRHLCNNRSCCNPSHLEVGTGKEGLRQNSLDTRSYHAGVKLIKEDIPEIREIHSDLSDNGWSTMAIYKHISSIYGVSPITIGDVIRRKTWADIK